MVTKQEFNAIRSLVETETQLICKFKVLEDEAKEPQLKEDLQKIIASLNNQKSNLINSLEV